MIYAVTALSLFFLTVPVFVNLKLYYCFDARRLCYGFTVFGLFRLSSGYLSVKDNFLVLNYSDKKAHASPLTDIFQAGKGKGNFSAAKLVGLKTTLFLGEFIPENLMIAAAAKTVAYCACKIAGNILPVDEDSVRVRVGRDGKYGVSSDLSVAFTILSLAVNILKNIYGSIYEYARR